MGLLDMGISFCYAQMLVDREFVRMIKRVARGITVDSDTLAVEVINAVGAGGNYLAEEHTIKHMRSEHARAVLIDRSNRQGWEKLGGKDMIARAREEVYPILENYKAKSLEKSDSEKIRQIIIEAEEEMAGKEL